MEEHIGKRVNHERVEEALNTDATQDRHRLPVLPRDDDRRRRRPCRADGQEKAEVLDVAQLLLASLDKSTVTLPEKGAAAEAPAARASCPRRGRAAPPRPRRRRRGRGSSRRGPAAEEAAAKPVTGLGIAGGAKRPGAKKTRRTRGTDRAAAAAAGPEGPRHRRRRQAPGAKKAAAAPPRRRAQRRCRRPGSAGQGPRHRRRRKRPGAKKAAPAAADAGSGSCGDPPSRQTEPTPVKGLGIAAGAKRPAPRRPLRPRHPRRRRARGASETARQRPNRPSPSRGQGPRHRRRAPVVPGQEAAPAAAPGRRRPAPRRRAAREPAEPETGRPEASASPGHQAGRAAKPTADADGSPPGAGPVKGLRHRASGRAAHGKR